MVSLARQGSRQKFCCTVVSSGLTPDLGTSRTTPGRLQDDSRNLLTFHTFPRFTRGSYAGISWICGARACIRQSIRHCAVACHSVRYDEVPCAILAPEKQSQTAAARNSCPKTLPSKNSLCKHTYGKHTIFASMYTYIYIHTIYFVVIKCVYVYMYKCVYIYIYITVYMCYIIYIHTYIH